MSQLVTKIRTDQGDLQIDYEALANLPMIINPNLLINSDFRNPINQRAQTEYATALDWTYSIDRWKFIGAMTVNTSNNVLTLTSNDTSATWFMQELEQELPVDTYTLTAKIVSVSGTCDVKLENSDGILVEKQISGAGLVTVTVDGKVGAVTFELNGTDGQLVIEWVKLEVGYDATAFSPRPYGEEVALCKRFFQSVNLYWRPGVVNSAGTVISFVTDVQLRTLPSGTPRVTLYQVPTRIRTTSSNSVDTTLTFESVYLANSMMVLNIASSASLEARSIAVPVDEFKVYVDAEIY